ncbi:MAG TPA: hypothetical protein DDZ51_01590 [Planctomycetaceae bacterium]|nr:hypothetical protein [Planctomycetaceae bacterium]
MKRTTRTDPIAGDSGRDRLPLSTFIVVMIWSIPAYCVMLYHFGGQSGDVDLFAGPEISFIGGIVVAGWLMISLWLTNGKVDSSFDLATDCNIEPRSEITSEPSVAKRDRWLTPNRWLCAALVAAVVMMIFTVHQFTPELSFMVAGVILWTTLGAIAPALHRQLTGRPIRYRPGLANVDADPTSSLGVRGLMVMTLCIAASIGAARRLSGGDLVPLYQPMAMGLIGGLVWVSMVLCAIGRKRRYFPMAVGLTAAEATVAGQWMLLSPAMDTVPVESVILFIVLVRTTGWIYLSVMRASGYRI